MAKFNEVIYMIFDTLKIKSDDSSINTDHIAFLMLNYRTMLLEQRYTDQKKSIPSSNFQTICVELEEDVDCINGNQVLSKDTIPGFTNLKGNETVTISPIGNQFSRLEFTYVSSERFPYVGHNKWLKNMVYFTTGNDSKLYLSGNNPNFKYLEKVSISAMFDNPIEALDMSCDEEGNACDYMESKFPLESALIPVLINMVVEHLSITRDKPEDNINDASDTLSGIDLQYNRRYGRR